MKLTGHLKPPPDKDLVMTLVLAAIAFTVFSLSSICLIRMRYTPEIQRRPRRHHETHEERLARDESRRDAVRGFFRGMFCGLLDFNEKDESPETAPSPQGRDLRSETPPTTTMEQELAGFREAASMVSNLIAAEEGRHSRMMQQRSAQPDIPPRTPPLPPPRPSITDPVRAMYPGYNNTSESSLPTYEFDSVEASMVSDGFRYSPSQFAYAPSSPTETGSQGTSSSDRLGYGNKD